MYLNDIEDIKKKMLLYADDIVTVPETEAWNMAYFCLKIVVRWKLTVNATETKVMKG